MKHILLVCAGNTCRSPMAEGILRAAIANDVILQGNVEVSSAGVYAISKSAAAANAIESLAEIGVDIGGHQAMRVTPALLEEADLVLALDYSVYDALRELYPWQRDKIYMLLAYATNQEDLPANEIFEVRDPYGGDRNLYGHTRDVLRGAMDNLVRRLRIEWK